ncbi:hypothetical protein [Roseovarius salinarum]|uniref:hypothetical protein n=1 Tax=Roseovarius salinarum TaxID=1981892 RepID=UPI000C330592|nr:hypothetical protein [Roseovarius salinarum]
MTTGKQWVKAGLVFLEKEDRDIAALGSRISDTMQSLGESVTGIRVISQTQVRVTARQHQVRVTLQAEQPVPMIGTTAQEVILVTVAEGEEADAPDGTGRSDRLLAYLVKKLHETLRCDYIQWLSPETVVSAPDFAAAARGERPRRAGWSRRFAHRHARGLKRTATRARADRPAPAAAAETPPGAAHAARDRFPSIEETSRILEARLDTEDPAGAPAHAPEADTAAATATEGHGSDHVADNDGHADSAPLRLGAWIMSFAVALFSLPVGAALVVYTMLRGENPRLAFQSMALTGTFIGLGTTASASEIIGVVASLAA